MKKGKAKEKKIEEYSKSKKIKTMIDFDQNECNSIKSIAIQKNLRLKSPQDFSRGKCFNVFKTFFKGFYIQLHFVSQLKK